jgi:hypothetical protein
MRNLSAAALAALNLENPKYFLLAKIEFSTPILATSLPYNITFNSETYYASSPVLSFGPPRVSTTVDRETYELALLDHDNSFQAYAKVGVSGRLLTIYAGFLDSTEQPLTGLTDVFIAYRGYIDSCKIVKDDTQKVFLLQAASPMGNLDATGGYVVSKDGMDQVSDTDTSFDDIYSSGKSATLLWGKS